MVILTGAAVAPGRVVFAVDESTANPWSVVVAVLVVLGAVLLGWSAFLQVRARSRRAASQRVSDTVQWPEDDAGELHDR